MNSRVTVVFCADRKIKMAPLRVEFCCKLCEFEVLALEHFETASSLSQPEGHALRKPKKWILRSTVIAPFKCIYSAPGY